MLKFTFDINAPGTASLISLNGSTTDIRSLRQGVHQIQIRFVQQVSGGISGDYEAADVSSYLGARIGIWSDSTGTLDDSSSYLLALTAHDQLTYNTDDAADPYFSGSLNLNTTELAAAMGSGLSLDAYFAVGLVRSDLTVEPIYDHKGSETCTVYSQTDDGSGTIPVSAIPSNRFITLPVYFQKTVSGVTNYYVADENADRTAVLITPYTP